MIPPSIVSLPHYQRLLVSFLSVTLLFLLLYSVAVVPGDGWWWSGGSSSNGDTSPSSVVSFHQKNEHPPTLILPDVSQPALAASSAYLPNSLTFIAIGDWGRGGKGGQEITEPALSAWAKYIKAEFIISVGDNVYVDGIPLDSSPSTISSIMSSFFTNVYKSNSLKNLPWYVIMGNHDYRGSVTSQLSWKNDLRWNANLFFEKRWTLPSSGTPTKSSSSSSSTSCLSAVFTDTTPLIEAYKEPAYRKRLPILSSNIDTATPQITVDWTKKSINDAAEACDAVFVIGHHPLYSPGEHANTLELIALYEPLFERVGVDAYLAGHDHILAHSKTKNGQVEHILTGAGSEVRPEVHIDPLSTQFVATVRGFTIHSVNATHAQHTYIWVGEGAGTSGDGLLPGRIAYQVIKPLRQKKREKIV